MSKDVKHWDDIYRKPSADIPWETAEPPKELVELVKTKTIPAGRALDLACGSGNHSVYLAQNGFKVSGVDFSKRAIDLAKKKAGDLTLSIEFIISDVMELEKLFRAESFDFILDYSLMHHIEPGAVNNHARQTTRLLRNKGKLLVVCFSEKDELASGKASAVGKYGNTMYFRSAEEIRKIYKDLKEISYKPARLGKNGKHPADCFLFEKD